MKTETKLVVTSVVLAAAVGLFYAPSAVLAGEEGEVPAAPVPELTKPGWYASMKEKANAYLSRDDLIEQERDQLKAALDVAVGKQRHHDAIVADIKAQNGRNTAHFETIISESEAEGVSLRADNELLRDAVEDFQNKDSNLMFVEGCFVPINTGQVSTQ